MENLRKYLIASEDNERFIINLMLLLMILTWWIDLNRWLLMYLLPMLVWWWSHFCAYLPLHVLEVRPLECDNIYIVDVCNFLWHDHDKPLHDDQLSRLCLLFGKWKNCINCLYMQRLFVDIAVGSKSNQYSIARLMSKYWPMFPSGMNNLVFTAIVLLRTGFKVIPFTEKSPYLCTKLT